MLKKFYVVLRLSLLACIVIPMVCGCSMNLAQNPPPGATSVENLAVIEANQPYLIQPGDQLEIKFYYNKDLNEKTIVRPDGIIALQLIDEVLAEGKTPLDLKNELTQKYTKYIYNPEITVIMQDFSSMSAYVGGEVGNPGLVNITGRTTIIQAVMKAGDMTKTAEKRNVVLLRHTSSGEPLFSVIDLDEILTKPDTKMNVVLKANDVIFVPKTAIAVVDQFIDEYFTQLIPISKNIGYSWVYSLNPEVQVKQK